MSKASNLFPDGRGWAIAVAGPPGTGKSTLAGSCAEFGKVKLLAPKPREVNSWLYRKHGLTADAEVFHDPLWRPTLKKFEANGFINFARRIEQLYTDTEYDFVVIDPYTDLVTLIAHELMKGENAASPRDMADSQGFYGALKHRLKEITQMITLLCHVDRPKHVIVTVHTMPTKDDQQLSRAQGGGTKQSSDNKAQGVEFEGSVLPMIEGGYRREFASEFDAMFFTEVLTKRERQGQKFVDTASYMLQAIPDNDRHSKSIFGDVFTEKYIPNHFGEILKAAKGGK